MNNSITLEIAVAIFTFVAPSVYVAYEVIRFNKTLKPKKH